jgi:hypothetical protein
MLNIMSSKTLAPSRAFEEARREGRESNLDWLARNIGDTDEAGVGLLLVGGRDLSSFRLRVAQSHLRHDMTPSHWSHVALLGARDDDIGKTRLREIYSALPYTSGAYSGDVKRYPRLFANSQQGCFAIVPFYLDMFLHTAANIRYRFNTWTH